jgi:hypothetical protein
MRCVGHKLGVDAFNAAARAAATAAAEVSHSVALVETPLRLSGDLCGTPCELLQCCAMAGSGAGQQAQLCQAALIICCHFLQLLAEWTIRPVSFRPLVSKALGKLYKIRLLLAVGLGVVYSPD